MIKRVMVVIDYVKFDFGADIASADAFATQARLTADDKTMIQLMCEYLDQEEGGADE